MALNGFHIRNSLNLKPLTVAPTNPVKGDVYYDDVESSLKQYNGTEFVTVGSSAGGYFKNYVQKFFDSDVIITPVNDAGFVGGTRTAANDVWVSTDTTKVNIQRLSSGSLRGTYNYQLTMNDFGSVESPLFSMDLADRDTQGVRWLTFMGDIRYLTSGFPDCTIYLVRYNSSKVEQFTAVLGSLPNRDPLGSFPVCVGNFIDSASSTDLYSLRFTSESDFTRNILIDRMTLTPDIIITNDKQEFKGVKLFLNGLTTSNFPIYTEEEDIDVIESGETRSMGRLVVPSGKTLEVQGDLLVVGAVTGTGTLTGSGVITSC